MARSTYIWLVTSRRTGAPLMSNTVKYEMVERLQRVNMKWEDVRIYRMDDNGQGSTLLSDRDIAKLLA